MMLGATSKFLGALVGLGSLALLANACGEDCTVSKTCSGAVADSGSSGGEGGLDSGADVVQPPAGCDPSADPKDAPACVVDGFGVFVDATGGNDANAGTKASPVKTITAAIGKVGNKPRIYVCEGTYAEHVKLTSAVSLYGGFACGAWTYSGTKAKVQPADGAKPTLDVTSKNITIADFYLLGAEQGAPNSVAVRVTDSTKIVFMRTRLEGRAGVDGSPGVRVDFTAFPTQSDLNGIDATGVAAGGERAVNCPGSQTTKGGKGGASGFDGDPGTPSLGGGAGGTVSQCQMSNTGGQPGTSGTTPAAAAGAQKAGALIAGEWTPEPGTAGTSGTPGQGGGGGAGLGGGFGGGGGAGGCGGAAGGGGNGGGASVPLISINSDVSLRVSELVAAKGGNGGPGVQGQQGQQLFGFGGNKNGGGCGGGNGAKGGNGGASGGGAGGLSVGILYKGTKPTLDATTITTGAFGTKGLGGAPGMNDGIDGQKADTLEAL
jgi:hypothetical protein